MNDIRRTLLWVVFSMSLVLLWDGWNKHNGRGSWFSPQPVPTQGTTPAANGAASAGALPVPSAAVAPGAGAIPGVAAGAAAAAAPNAAAPAAQLVTVATDLLRVTFDGNGGDPVRVELLKQTDSNDPKHNVVLFDRSAERRYVAQTGVLGVQGGVPGPTHLTPMKWVAGKTELETGSDTLEVRFESGEVGGATLAKTYVLKRGS